MEFEWDETKNKSNFRKHGFDFEYAAHIFGGITLTVTSAQRIRGEYRNRITGTVEANTVTVIAQWRGGRCRIISARLASRKERHDYAEAIQRTWTG